MPIRIRLIDCIKIGVGFFIGYEIAKNTNEIAGEVYNIVKERIKKGYTA